MTLNKREKILAIATASLLALFVAYLFWPSGGISLADLRTARDKLLEDEARAKNQALQAKKDAQRLSDWQNRSLPSELDKARSEYENWVHELAKRVQFSNIKFTSVGKQERPGLYTQFTCDLQCQGTLDQLTRFLYEFYSAGHLHKIRLWTLKPVEKSPNQLDLKITIEALSLPGATRKDKLSTEPIKRLKLASLEDYTKTIVGRNLFAAYAPKPVVNPQANEQRPDPALNALQFSFLTAIIEADGVPEAWVFERTSGQTFKLHEGKDFTIANVRGKVNRIGYSDMEIEIGGQIFIVGYGDSLKK